MKLWGKKLWCEFKRENEVNWEAEIIDNRDHPCYHKTLQLLQLALKFIIFIMMAVSKLTIRSCY